MAENTGLEIRTATVSIKVIRVDGHKMTKATFRQIIIDDDGEIAEENIIGWVNDDNAVVVLFTIDGELRKRTMRRTYEWITPAFSDQSIRAYTTVNLHGLFLTQEKQMPQNQYSYVMRKFEQLFIAT
jgi:Iap family predicted aminopeptidase